MQLNQELKAIDGESEEEFKSEYRNENPFRKLTVLLLIGEDNTEFEYLRPIFILLLGISFFLLFVLLITKRKVKTINGLFVVSMSFICVSVSAIATWQIGIIADELNLGGDAVSTLLSANTEKNRDISSIIISPSLKLSLGE